MKRKLLLVAAFIVTATGFYFIGRETKKQPIEQEKGKGFMPGTIDLADTITTINLTNDFLFYRKTLESLHPGLYKWHSRQEMDALFDSIGALLKHAIPRSQFYTYLSIINNRIGCSHTELKLYGQIWRNGLFPLPMAPIGNDYYSTCKNCDVPKGSRLLSINGEQMNAIARRLSIYGTIDGCNNSISRKFIIEDFSVKYFLAYGQKDSFVIQFENPSTKKIRTIELKSCFSGSSLPADWHPFWYSDFDYDLKLVDDKPAAVLKLRTFSYDGSRQAAYEDFLENTFRQLFQNPQITTLILDLRNNLGGNNKNCYLLYSYLSKKGFVEDSSNYTNNVAVPEENSLDGTEDKFMDSVKKKYYQVSNDLSHLVFVPSRATVWKRSKYAFKGTIFVITNYVTGSASVRLTSLLQINDSAKVVGEKPNGSYWGSSSYWNKSFLLPNSSISFTVPLVSVKYNLSAYPYPLNGTLVPDYFVLLDHDDFLSGEDTQIKYILKNLAR